MPYYGPLPQLVVGQSASRLAVSDPGLSATLQNFQVGADPYVPPAQWTATADAYTAGGFLRSRNVAGAPILSRAIEGSGLYVFEASFEQPEGAIRILDTLGGALIINPQGAAGPLVLYHDSPANQPAAFQYGVLSAVCAIKGELNLTTGHLKLYTKRDGVDLDFVLRLENTRAGRTFNAVELALSQAAKLDTYVDAAPLPVTITNAPEDSRVVVNGVEYDPALGFPVATAGSFVWLVGADGAALALPCFAKSGNVLSYVGTDAGTPPDGGFADTFTLPNGSALDPTKWAVVQGSFTVQDGRAASGSADSKAFALQDLPEGDWTIEADVSKADLSGVAGGGLLFGALNTANFLIYQWQTDSPMSAYRVLGGVGQNILGNALHSPSTGLRRLKVQKVGDTITCSVDGQQHGTFFWSQWQLGAKWGINAGTSGVIDNVTLTVP